jgi:imidazole glycerol phosphate synthase subunit HisF
LKEPIDAIRIMPCLDMTVLLAASVFHYRTFTIRQVKQYPKEKGLSVRLR